MLTRIFALAGAATIVAGIVMGCGADSAGISSDDGGVDGGDASTPPDAASPTDASDAGAPPVETFAIGGQVKGLAGTGLVLQNNTGDNISINANGVFTFPTKIAKGASFVVTVKTQPSAPAQTCTVSGGTGTVVAGNVTTVVVDCDTNTFTIGGSVSGLAGSGLILQNSAGDDITVNANGDFAFPTPVVDGAGYAVTVKTQPTNLSQTCTVTSGSGTVASADVTSVAVTCVTNKYTIGGTVIGLAGTGLELQNNGGDDLVVNGSTFVFATSLFDGTGFAVTVKTSPTSPTQSCTVSGGTGTLAGGNVSSVTVNCATDVYAVSGTVSGLAGGGLVLQNNGGDDVPVTLNGGFAFPTAIADLQSYDVTVKTQPTNKWQTCAVTNGSGTIAASAVSNVSVTCTTNKYKVKGTVTGLDGSGLVLQNNAGDGLPISKDGSFEFVTSVASGDGYLVSVQTQPTDKTQTCTVTNGTGNVAGADIENVTVACVTNKYTVGGSVAGLAGNGLILQNNAGDDLPVGQNGDFTFLNKLESGSSFAVTVKTQPSGLNQQCVVSGGTGTVTAGNIVSVVVNCTTDKYTVGGTVSGLDGTGLVLQNNLGADLPVNGSSFAFPAQDDGTAYSVTVKTQPTNKSQTCTVSNGTGNVAGANVQSVTVSCTTNKFTVGGSVTGLAGSGLVLQNNLGADLPVSSSSFTFPAQNDGTAYSVTVKTQPTNKSQTCSVTNGTGNVAGANVQNVTVSCSTNTYNVGGTITGLTGTVVLTNNGGNDLTRSANGTFTFTTKVASGSTYAVAVKTNPAGQICTVTNDTGTVTSADVTNVTVTCEAAVCGGDPKAVALAACQALFPNCQDDGSAAIIGWASSRSMGYNCYPDANLWQQFCYADGYDNYNCNTCTIGKQFVAHDPCVCGDNTSGSGQFCP